MEPVSAFVAHVKKYIALNDTEAQILRDHCQTIVYKKNSYILRAGEICRNQHFVAEGCVKTGFTDREGEEHVISFATENWWTADLGSFLAQTPADYHIQCLEDCTIIQISYQQVQELYIKIPALERFFRILVQNAYVAAQKRIVQNFSMPAQERYEQFLKQYPKLEQRVPQYLIASYLGITKEFLSKIRKRK